MRSKNFVSRSGKTNLRGNREKKIEKRTNWDRIVYLIFLGILVIIFGYILIRKVFFVTGEGFLMEKNMEVRAPGDLKITAFFINQHDSIFQGEKLFAFVNTDNENRIVQNNARQTEIELDRKREIDPVKNEIDLLLREIAILRENLSFYKQREVEIRQKIKLDIATMNNLNNVQDEIQVLQTKIKLKEAELRTLYNKQNGIKDRYQILLSDFSHGSAYALEPTEYYSPVKGTIDEIFVAENEMIFESEPIMSIQIVGSQMFIIAKFDRDDAKYLLPGTILNVKFANGERSEGIVRKNYVPKNNTRLPENQYKGNIEEFIAINLYPVDQTAKGIWKSYEGMSVKVWRSIF
ncbi:MAG TPA: hypothetical protein VFM82_06490 [Flavobacteriaceae bacterium]|nr:hypothetical protein [Flavobacteriaceae bacterium]